VKYAKSVMLVIDASALVDQLLRLDNAGSIDRHMVDHAGDLHAPHVVDLEVLGALRRADASGLIGARTREMVGDFLDLPIDRYPHAILAARIWELRHNFSVFDATYVALAESLADGTPLLTSDARLARAARKHTGVEVLLAA
jgi:predicted nucleic acid-binding protein